MADIDPTIKGLPSDKFPFPPRPPEPPKTHRQRPALILAYLSYVPFQKKNPTHTHTTKKKTSEYQIPPCTVLLSSNNTSRKTLSALRDLPRCSFSCVVLCRTDASQFHQSVSNGWMWRLLPTLPASVRAGTTGPFGGCRMFVPVCLRGDSRKRGRASEARRVVVVGSRR